nr:transforming acidic coiled-coil-containing protein 3 [Biomphalaria glabrata]
MTAAAMDVNDENAPPEVQVKHHSSSSSNANRSSPLKLLNDARRLSSQQKQKFSPEKVTPVSSPYMFIRELDSAERWIERTSVVTKKDHVDNLENAKIILQELVGKLPVESFENDWIHEAVSDNVTKAEQRNNLPVKPKTSSEIDELACLLNGLEISPDLSLVSESLSATMLDHFLVGSETEELKSVVQTTIDKEKYTNLHAQVAESHDLAKTSFEKDKDGDKLFKLPTHITDSPVLEEWTALEEKFDPLKPYNEIANSPIVPKSAIKEDLVDTLKLCVQKCGIEENIDNPFETQIQIVHSPVLSKPTIEDDIVDPFKPRMQVANSPILTQPIEVDKDDLFRPSEQITNSPVVSKPKNEVDTIDPFKLSMQMANSPILSRAIEEVKDNFKPFEQIVYSPKPTIEENTIDPFKPHMQMVNSPVLGQPFEAGKRDHLKPQEPVTNSPVIPKPSIDDTIDPFKPQMQMANSPIEAGKRDLLKSCEPIAHSPVVPKPTIEEDTIDPFKPRMQMVNSPVLGQPFEAGKRDLLKPQEPVTNSPVIPKPTIDDIIDPFKLQMQMANSPIEAAKRDLLKTCKPTIEDNTIDPFKPHIQMVNSPVLGQPFEAGKRDLLKPQEPVTNSPVIPKPTIDDTIDPFKPQMQMANSPIEVGKRDLLKSSEPIAYSPVVPKPTTEEDTIDPFKPRIQMVNSPVLEKPFEAGKIGLLKSCESIVNSPVGPKSTIEDATIDPFKPRMQMANSPVLAQPTEDKGYLSKPQEPITNSSLVPKPILEDDTIDPFKPCKQMANSPEIDKPALVENDPFKPHIQMTNSLISKLKTEDSRNELVLNPSQPSFQSNSPINTNSLTVQSKEKNDHDLLSSSVRMGSGDIVDNLPVKGQSDSVSTSELCLADQACKSTSECVVQTNMGCCDTTLRKHSSDDKISTSSQFCNTTDTQKLECVATDSLSQCTLDGSFYSALAKDHTVDVHTKGSLYDSVCLEGKQLNGCFNNQHFDDGKINSLNTIEHVKDSLQSPFSVHNEDPLIKKLQITDSPLTIKDTTTQKVSLTSEFTGSQNDSVCHSGTVEKINQVSPSVIKSYVKSKNGTDNSKLDCAALVSSYDVCAKPKDISTDFLISSTVSTKQDNSVVSCNTVVASDKIVALSPQKDELKANKNTFIHPAVSEDFGEHEQFVPATDGKAFHEGISRRGSVLMKFDPLMKSDPVQDKIDIAQSNVQKPGHTSDIFSTSKNLGVSFMDESACLFGTPPRVARRRTLTRNIHNNRVQPIFEEAAPNQIDMILALDNELDDLDTVMHDNLLTTKTEGAKLVDIGEIPKYTESEMQQIRAQLALHFQDLMLKKDKEFQGKLKQQEDLLNEEKNKAKVAYDALKKKNKVLQGKLRSFDELMKEYTDIITQITTEKEKIVSEQEKQAIELVELQKSNGQILEDNKALEKSFADLYHRYEKLKETLDKAAENEKILKKAAETAQEKYKSVKETNKKLKTMAEEKIAEAEDKFEKLSSSSKAEITRLEASLKKNSAQIQTLESILERKTQENKELTELCDSLISKVSQ